VTWKPNGGLKELLTVTGFSGLPHGVDAGPEVRPPAELGPAYLVRYDLGVPWAAETEFRQVLYPVSSAGPLVLTPPGQTPYDVVVRGGWAKARVDLARFLRDHGITVAAEVDENRRPGWWPAAGLVVLLVLGAVFSSLRRRWTCRRRRPPGPGTSWSRPGRSRSSGSARTSPG
jgi:hypothetical protein